MIIAIISFRKQKCYVMLGCKSTLKVGIRLMREKCAELEHFESRSTSPVVGTGVLIGAVADIRGENQAAAPLFLKKGVAGCENEL